MDNPNLVAGNIKDGVTINGITGTLNGETVMAVIDLCAFGATSERGIVVDSRFTIVAVTENRDDLEVTINFKSELGTHRFYAVPNIVSRMYFNNTQQTILTNDFSKYIEVSVTSELINSVKVRLNATSVSSLFVTKI